MHHFYALDELITDTQPWNWEVEILPVLVTGGKKIENLDQN